MNQYPLKNAARVSLFLLFILFIGAIVFYKLRMTFLDATGIAFGIINENKFAIQEHRYGSFITQMVPFFGQKLHLSLRAILIAYSASFNLFYLLVACILYRFKEYGLVVLTALYFTLFVSDTYFWTNNEVHQGIGWMMLMFGSLIYMEGRKVKMAYTLPVFFILCFLAIFSHPLVMLATGFLWGFFTIEHKREPFTSRRSLFYLTGMALIIGVKFYMSTHGWYDGCRIENVTHTTLPKVLATFTSGMADNFWKNCLTNYWSLLIIFVIGVSFLLKEKKYLLTFWTIGCVLGYFVLICLTYSAFVVFYIESEWMIISIIGATPFVYYLVPRLKNMQVVWLMIFIFSVRLAYIAASEPKFEKRMAFLQKTVDRMKEMNITKAVILEQDTRLEDSLIMAWSLPVETLFLGVLNGDTILRSAIKINPADLEARRVTENKYFMSSFFNIPYEAIDNKYFPVDTTQLYKVFTFDEFYGGK